MPQFSYSATDAQGNKIEGALAADDMMHAADQVKRMGYTPLQVQVATETAVGQPTLAMSAPVAVGAEAQASGRPALIDLTQPLTELPAAANTLLAPLGEESNVQTGRIEPWQRGGPIEQPTGPAMTLSNGGVLLNRTQPMVPGNVKAPPIVERGVERPTFTGIPYGGVPRPKTLWTRFKEVMIYPVFAGVVVKDLAPFFRQFATLINAGLPIYQALVGLEGNTNNGRLKEVAREGQRQVQAGGKFSDVMAAYPWIFQPMQIEIVRAAEMGGMLDEALLQIADYIEHELEIRRLISRETAYPKLVMFVALMLLGRSGFTGGTMAIVSLVLGSMGKATYGFSEYMMDTFGFAALCLLPILGAVAVFRLFLFNVPGVREAYDTFKIRIPGLGKLVRMFSIAKFMRTYAALYKAGFGMGSALEIAGDASGNAVVRRAAHRAVVQAESGGFVSQALASTGIFPSMAIDMLRTGETTGSMDQMLNSVANYYESEGKLKSHQMALIFGVAVFLIVAILIGIQVVSFWTGYGNQVNQIGNQ